MKIINSIKRIRKYGIVKEIRLKLRAIFENKCKKRIAQVKYNRQRMDLGLSSKERKQPVTSKWFKFYSWMEFKLRG